MVVLLNEIVFGPRPPAMKTIEGKLVVLGAQGVGKTSMVVRYIGKMFSNHISPTIGASFFSCNINIGDTRVKLQVWDTAGQERFKSMAPMYYRNSNAALLVYDITQISTFEAVKQWVKELQKNVEEPLILCVVGNKSDLTAHRKVPISEAVNYASAIGASYFESSALTDTGIEDVFISCATGLITISRDQLMIPPLITKSEEELPAPNIVLKDTTTKKKSCC